MTLTMTNTLLAFPERGFITQPGSPPRPTGMRATILDLLIKADRPVAAYWLIDRLRTTGKLVAPPTVYRALNALQRAGLAHKVESLSAFTACRHPDHDHQGQFLICSECGKTEELADHDVAERMRESAERQGFQPAHQVIEVLGTCASCAKGHAKSNVR